MLVCCHSTYLHGEAGGKACFQQGPLGKRKQKRQRQDIPGYMPSRNSPAPSHQQSFLASCLIQPEVEGAKGFKLGLANQREAFGQLSLAVNWDHGALDHAEHWEKQARLALGMELSWRRLGLPLWLRRKSRVFTLTWPQRHYKWQHMAAPWGTASSGPSLHPPVHLCLLLMLRGKYLAKI